MSGNLNQSTETKEMLLTRVFDAPVARVWRAWSDPERVMRWWGPTGFTSPSAEMDFREGGVSLVCMRAPIEYGGGDMYNTWTYRKITPMQRIEFIQHFSDKDGNPIDPAAVGLPPGIPYEVPHVITFRPNGDKTIMTVTEYGYTNNEVVELSRGGMEQCLDKMAESLKEWG